MSQIYRLRAISAIREKEKLRLNLKCYGEVFNFESESEII